MSSRLDRLFVLLDSGSSAVTRKAAAVQLGEVQKLHPHELNNLLSQLHQYICKPSWDTRIAAGQAVEAIAKNVPQWNPQESMIKEEKENPSQAVSQTGRMKFSLFDIDKVLKSGSFLLGSEGKEYEHEDEVNVSASVSGLDAKEKLASQRQLLNKKLGLDVAQKIGIDTSDIFTNDDLVVHTVDKNAQKKLKEAQRKAVAELVEVQMSQISGLSSREMNRAKRKAKLVAKQKSKDASNSCCKDGSSSGVSTPDIEPAPKKLKSVLVSQPANDDAMVVDNVIDNSEPLWEEDSCWPFESFCDQLCQDLFSPAWETRHGAATALREVIKIHGRGAGRSLDVPVSQMNEVNQLWLEDVALRLLCVMALDRFGDFISDQVVAPVRETCAQVLGSVFNLMWKSSVKDVLGIILQLLRRPEWEVRHGGLLAMKYLLAVRKDMTEDLLPATFVHIYQGLSDPVDDVVAVAASALVPVSDCVIQVLPTQVPSVVNCLWDSLLELDDLCASTSSIMALLTSILSHPTQISVCTHSPLNELVPRLWPFLSHASTSVRKCVLKTLLTLTSPKNLQNYETWIPLIVQDLMRHLYQRCMLEHVPQILDMLYEIWKQILVASPLSLILTSTCPWMSSWLCLMMQPSRIPIDPNSLLEAHHKSKSKKNQSLEDDTPSENKYFIGGETSLHESLAHKEEGVIRSRCMGAKFLGLLSCYVSKPMPGITQTAEMESPIDCYAKIISFHLNSRSALQRLCISLVVKEWAVADPECPCPESVKSRLIEVLSEGLYYDEIAVTFTTCQQECLNFIAMLRHYQLPVDEAFPSGTGFLSIEQALQLSQTISLNLISAMKNKPKVKERLEERRKAVLQIVQQTNKEFQVLNIQVQAAIASAVIHLKALPGKLNPVIRPIMDSIKKESMHQFQKSAGRTLTLLFALCLTREPCPNAKIVKNLCTFVCSHAAATPQIAAHQNHSNVSQNDTGSGSNSPVIFAPENDKHNVILTLVNLQKEAEKTSLKRSASVVTKKSVPGGSSDDNADEKNTEIQRKGAIMALEELCFHFGSDLPQKIPKLWEMIYAPIDAYMKAVDESSSNFSQFANNDTSAQELVYSLQILEVVCCSLQSELKVYLESHLHHIILCLQHPYSAVRHVASRCFGMLSKVILNQTMQALVDEVMPLLTSSEVSSRQGAVECLACVIESLGISISPYIVLLILPSLGSMSDQNKAVRTMATHCFGTLIRLMPLEGGLKAQLPDLNKELLERREKERKFLDQLLDTKKLENFQIPVPINAKLRSYQQDGVNWLWFLNRYKLHGILCDDMGLGKTLQSICILAGDHHYNGKAFKQGEVKEAPLPSLVVCPPTLTGHWVYEVEKFISSEYLDPLHYVGLPAERERLQRRAKYHNLVIASYDIVRNDFDFFGSIKWNYCILDEGHVIKNGKTKLAKAIKQLTANHRLVLSGTPIQNNVLELWSLFDFLMPGFLGTERQFQAQYSRPILLSRDAKSSSKEQEAGAMAMEALHRQVLPFLLRRMKEDVLKDLPPKIIQDYCCELSPLQQQIYEDFEKTKAKKSVEETLSHDEEKVNEHEATHIFQALQYLRKVCNHPKLVLTKVHPQFEKISEQLKKQGTVLNDINHAAKLPALKQLLTDCGIGTSNGNASNQEPEPAVNQHRALIFCQLKAMLDIVEKDLLKTHMPTVTYLRLDGSVPAGQRHSVVHRFNNDPSIDVLLLTTQVGGVGLNLTGADTVIFVEHDWNPMRDLQAMDRAHRIGQKKVVNVYRLITKGTLEEKIMSLQQFKLNVANTVISEDNSSLQTMGTNNLLDLFSLDEAKRRESSSKRDSTTAGKDSNTVKNIIDNLPDLWEESQYEEEYDLSHFMRGLVK